MHASRKSNRKFSAFQGAPNDSISALVYSTILISSISMKNFNYLIRNLLRILYFSINQNNINNCRVQTLPFWTPTSIAHSPSLFGRRNNTKTTRAMLHLVSCFQSRQCKFVSGPSLKTPPFPNSSPPLISG